MARPRQQKATRRAGDHSRGRVAQPQGDEQKNMVHDHFLKCGSLSTDLEKYA